MTLNRALTQRNTREIASRDVEAALKRMKNGTASGNDHININTLKPGKDTISSTFVKLYNKCIPERHILLAWKNATIAVFFKNGNKKDFMNFRPKCLLSDIYKVLTKVLKKTREDTQRKPPTRARWIQKHILNDRPHTRRKRTEGKRR